MADLITYVLFNTRFLIYRRTIEKNGLHIALSIRTINSLKKSKCVIAKSNGDWKNFFENGMFFIQDIYILSFRNDTIILMLLMYYFLQQ